MVIGNSKIIMVHSYKGGTGKTSIAINLARYLTTQKKQKVLLIEQDTKGATFKTIFKVKPKKTWNDFYSQGQHIKDLITYSDNIDIICASNKEINIPTNQSPKIFYARQLERTKLQKKWLKDNYDYVILDTQPGYSIELINSILISDIAILLTRLDVDTIEMTIEMYKKIYSQFDNKQIILVQNQVPTPVEGLTLPKRSADVKKAMKEWNDFSNDKELISIPLSNEIAYTLLQSKISTYNSLFMGYIEKIVNIFHL